MLRVMTYNIRAGLGTDGVRSLQRIAQVIGAQRPEIVALQEVDFIRHRSELVDQASRLAELLGMHCVAAPSFLEEPGGYGNTVLSAHPAELVHHAVLPHIKGPEPRAAMLVRIRHERTDIHVINTHLSFRRADRPGQIDTLLGPEWLGRTDLGRHVLLCGDLNCSSRHAGFRRLQQQLTDAQRSVRRRSRATWATRYPIRCLDHILVGSGFEVVDAHVLRSRPAQQASDHFPVLAELRFIETRPGGQ